MNFLKSTPRFSFLYGGEEAFSLSPKTTVTERDNELTTEYLFPDGLKVTNIAKKHEKYGAWEWINYFENIGKENTRIISELYDGDFLLPMPHGEKLPSSPWTPKIEENTIIYNPNGSTTVDEFDFYTHVDDSVKRKNFAFVGRSAKKTYKSIGGRSSDGNAPFFNIHQGGIGYFVGLGWTGQWNAKFLRTEDAIRVLSKIEDTEFYLEPGEKIRTLSVVVMPYTASVEDSHNIWRRFIREVFSPTYYRTDGLPLSAGFWGGTKSEDMVDRVKVLTDNNIPVNTIWIDAGWCGADTLPSANEFSGDWASHTGDWEMSRLIHPKGMEDVSKAIHESGRRMLLWFEPERVKCTTAFAKLHPEWLIPDASNQNLLMYLGNEDALNYCIEFLSDYIERLHIDVYRQDFNFAPLEIWRSHDKEGRRGITEIKHIMGLYRMWDTLLERFPWLIIDNCASGGKRLDMETTKRSFPMWRSDAQCPADPIPEISQVNNMNFSMWLPLTMTGTGRVYDTYAVRSAYGAGLTSSYSYSSDESFGSDPKGVDWFRERCEEYLKIRSYFNGDMYHLTEPQRNNTSWCAVQWHRPESGDGMVQVFVRKDSVYPTACFALRKLDPEKNYLISDIDGGEQILSGKTLSETGFLLNIPEKRVAKIYLYKEI